MKSELMILTKGRRQNSKMGRLLRNRESGKSNLYYELSLTSDRRKKIYVECEIKSHYEEHV